MDGLNILFLIFIYILGGILILGIIFITVGISHKILHKDRTNTDINKGLAIISLPIGLIMLYFTYQFISNLVLTKPTKKELAGTYKITKVTNLDIDKSVFNDCNLILKNDSFFISFVEPFILKNKMGIYKLDYSKSYRELTFVSDKWTRTAYIDRHYNSYTIRLEIGGGESRKRIYFEKIE